jgi:general secretion pathway protein C
MASRRTPLLVHLIGAAAASAVAAYWILRLMTPAPPVVPVTAAPIATREPDARLAARFFGDVNSGAVVAVLNAQVAGVFFAGADSSAVISVDGKPPRAVLLGGEIAPGTRLVDVQPDRVTIERDGVRSQLMVPPLALAKSSEPLPGFHREGSVLSAPSQDVAPPSGRFPTARGVAPPGVLMPGQGNLRPPPDVGAGSAGAAAIGAGPAPGSPPSGVPGSIAPPRER